MSADDRIGTELDGRYRLELLLGDGGMGEVYQAEQLSLGRSVAVKVLREEVADRPDMLQRFQREAKILSHLDHPGLVGVHDFGVHEGCPYLVMDLARGKTLEALLRERGTLPVAEAVGVLLQLCQALAHAHGLGIVHRDLKPENIVMDEHGRTRILDFGIARMVAVEEAEPQLTATGMMVGTPQYVAPEQATGKPIDARTDLYALGLVAFRILAGRSAFQKSTAGEYLVAHVTELPPALDALGVASPELASVVQRLLEKEPDHRYPSAEATHAALEALDLGAAGNTRQLFGPPDSPDAAAPEPGPTLDSRPAAVPAELAGELPAPAPPAPPAAPATPSTRRPPSRITTLIGAAVGLATIGLAVILAWQSGAAPAVTRGRNLLAAGKLEQAHTQIAEAIEGEPDPAIVAELRATLGRVHQARGAPEKAVEEFTLAVAFDPDALEPADLEALVRLLENRGPPGTEAEHLLLQLEGRALAPLRALVERQTQEARVRLRAGALIERLGEEVDLVPALIAALEAEACEERRQAIRSLGKRGDPRALAPLQVYVAGREGLLARFACGRAAAVTALEQISAAGD